MTVAQGASPSLHDGWSRERNEERCNLLFHRKFQKKYLLEPKAMMVFCHSSVSWRWLHRRSALLGAPYIRCLRRLPRYPRSISLSPSSTTGSLSEETLAGQRLLTRRACPRRRGIGNFLGGELLASEYRDAGSKRCHDSSPSLRYRGRRSPRRPSEGAFGEVYRWPAR